MSSLQISQLQPIGSDLLQDSESFLHELSDQETMSVTGGLVITQVTVSVAIPSVGGDANRVATGVVNLNPEMRNFLQTHFRHWLDVLDRATVVPSIYGKTLF